MNRLSLLLLFSAILIVLLLSCKKENPVETIKDPRPIPGRPPTAPSQLRITGSVLGELDLAWVATSSNASGFQIQRHQNAGDWRIIDSVDGSMLTYQSKNLLCREKYYFRVAAYNDSGISFPSNVVSATTRSDSIVFHIDTAILDHLYSVAYATELKGFIVGEKSVLFRTTDGGITWDPIVLGPSDNLRAVAFANSTNGMIAGDYGTIFRTVDGGGTWTRIGSGVADHLNGVASSDGITWIAVGQHGVILLSTNSGLTWSQKSSTSTAELLAVTVIDQKHAAASGVGGTLIHTTDGGLGWTVQIRQTLNNLTGVYFSDTLHGTAVGTPSIVLHTTNGGLYWSIGEGAPLFGFNAMSFADARNGFGVTSVGGLLQTIDGGETWKYHGVGVIIPMYGVFANRSGLATAVGARGTIYRMYACPGP